MASGVIVIFSLFHCANAKTIFPIAKKSVESVVERKTQHPPNVYITINDETKSNEKYIHIKHRKWDECCDFD